MKEKRDNNKLIVNGNALERVAKNGNVLIENKLFTKNIRKKKIQNEKQYYH